MMNESQTQNRDPQRENLFPIIPANFDHFLQVNRMACLLEGLLMNWLQEDDERSPIFFIIIFQVIPDRGSIKWSRIEKYRGKAQQHTVSCCEA